MNNYHFFFIRVDFNIENNILPISSASRKILSNVLASINEVSLSNDSQYFVSRHSLYAIDILFEKSAFEMAPFASEIFAPIDVPHLTNYFDIINSFFSLLRNWYALTIRMAN